MKPNSEYFKDVDEDIREEVIEVIQNALQRAAGYKTINADDIVEIIREATK